jgi:hypothetical protein
MNGQDQRAEEGYYTDQEIAQLLGISLGRLRNKLTAGSPLPPRIQPPGCRNRLWPRATVHAWLAQYLIGSDDDSPSQHLPGRRGRPTKQALRARRS